MKVVSLTLTWLLERVSDWFSQVLTAGTGRHRCMLFSQKEEVLTCSDMSVLEFHEMLDVEAHHSRLTAAFPRLHVCVLP